MFRRRWHQYIAVFLHNGDSAISVLTREITTKRKVDLSLMDEIKRLVCEKDGFKQDDLVLLNFIYLGKGVERNVRTMETSKPGSSEGVQQEATALQSQHQDPPARGGKSG